MGDILFCTFYLLLFSVVVWKAPLFNLPGLNKKYSLGAFYLKLLFAIALWYIYAYHYKNRYSSDIFKYYDDGRLLFNTMHTSFPDFLKMLTGIGDSDAHIQGYYHSMVSWVNAHDSTLYNNSHLLIRLNALFMFFSFGHYGVHVVFMCFISLAGLAYLYKAFYTYLTDVPKMLFAAVFLFPSVLLWGSGILKEGLVLFALGITIYYGLESLAVSRKWLGKIVLFVIGIILLFELKAYVLICLIPGIVAEIVISKVAFAKKYPVIAYIAALLVCGGEGIKLHLTSSNLDPLKMLSDKQIDFMRTAKGGIYLTPLKDSTESVYINVEDSVYITPTNTYSDSLLRHAGIQYLTSASFCYNEQKSNHMAPYRLTPGLPYDLIHSGDTTHLASNDSALYRLDTYIEPAKSRLVITPFQPTVKGFLAYVPTALNIALLRPYPHELHSSTLLIYFVENCVMLLLIFLAFAFMKRKNPNAHLALFCLSYCLLMLVIIGISTPLYGGIERYKSVVIPFMLILLLLIYDRDKFKRSIKKR